MTENKMLLYSIMGLDIDHADEICADICAQVERGVSTCPLFCMTLVPEGDPVVDKVGPMCEKYMIFRDKLHAMGIPNGVLVQASIGHGWVLSKLSPYTKYKNLTDGKEVFVCCPYDDNFCSYIENVTKTIAACKPDTIMIDDDFRLIYREGKGCACDLHMNRFRELSGTDMTREELVECMALDTEESCRLADIFVETQKEALLKAARAMRAGIDSVEPAMPVSFCSCGNNMEFAAEIAQILAGEGNPVVVRINNGNYLCGSGRQFSKVYQRAAQQICKLKGKVDLLLAETDTCPQNRYSTSARALHAHFTGTILEGARGAKHWITRLSSYEPGSGKAYRSILAKNSGFYNALMELVPTLQWRGCRIAVSDTPSYDYSQVKAPGFGIERFDTWSINVLERLGVPMYFSDSIEGASFLEGPADSLYSDKELLQLLSGTVFLAADTAGRLIDRGFGAYIGVDVKEWEGETARCEFLTDGSQTSVMGKTMHLIPLTEEVRVESMLYRSQDDANFTPVTPGVTVYKNSLGGMVVTFCGSPDVIYTLGPTFALLNETRKRQMASLLKESGNLPVYYPEDNEVYLRAADMPDGGLFVEVMTLGIDPLDEIVLCADREIKCVQRLMPDGSRKDCTYFKEAGGIRIEESAPMLEPVILFLYS
ncbi:MAG: hypothetical protein IKC46_10995 [Lachnospiraceae bacterium]|nr:hypothetical protein [Lachnospiraceae bacterium]